MFIVGGDVYLFLKSQRRYILCGQNLDHEKSLMILSFYSRGAYIFNRVNFFQNESFVKVFDANDISISFSQKIVLTL